uniref:Cen12_3 n=1 Tax=Solanum tuberosum TaxID=4113 RepID=M1DB18_SOLTU
MTAQDNREFIALENPNVGTTTTRIWDFTMMNPSKIQDSKVDEVYKIVRIIGLSMAEKAELATYQLKGIAQVWFEQWKVHSIGVKCCL